MRFSFFLQDKNKQKSAVYMACFISNKRIKISTGIKVETKSWDVDRGQVKKNNVGQEVNARLKQIESIANDAYNVARYQGITDSVELFKYVKNAVTESDSLDYKAPSKNTVLAAFDMFIEQLRQGKRPSKRKVSSNVSHSYLQMFITLKNILSGIVAPSERFAYLESTEFAAKFNAYRSEHWNDVSATKYIRLFRRFLLWTRDTALYKFDEFPQYLTLPDEREPSLFALSREELRSIELLDLSHRPSLDKVRDLFLVSCYTGLRYSDVSRLAAEHIGTNAITISAQKTGITSRCPITPILRTVLDKYAPEYQFHRISSQKANEHLKTIAMLAGITSEMEIVEWRAGKKSTAKRPKNELIAWHCSRRTFITLSLVFGINPSAVQAVSGHKKDSKSFGKYILFAENQIDDAMSQVWK